MFMYIALFIVYVVQFSRRGNLCCFIMLLMYLYVCFISLELLGLRVARAGGALLALAPHAVLTGFLE